MNVFVYRRVIDNVLELFEEFLDNNFLGNYFELWFIDGVFLLVVYIFEIFVYVSLLIVIINSVYRIVFFYLNRFYRYVSFLKKIRWE